jgi:hypothetical protein
MMQSSQERLDNDVANGLGLISDKLVHEGGFWGVIGGLNDNLANFGFAVVGIFIASWIVSTLVRSPARCRQPRQLPKLRQLERRDRRP